MLKIAVLMDPIESINEPFDTSLRLLREASKRKWELFYLEPKDLFLKSGVAYASLKPLRVFDNPKKYYELDAESITPLSAIDALIMRKDPPFSIDYVYLTYFLEIAHSQGCHVVNHPRSLRDANEKIFASWFPDLIAPTLMTQRKDLFLDFVKEHQHVVIKPLDLMGGRSVYAIKYGDPKALEYFNELSLNENRIILVQPYLPEVETQGDKRIFLVDGVALEDVLLRMPKSGDFRANMAAGGSISLAKLSSEDRHICERLGPVLKKMGILFAGIDVIGKTLSEINITSPTGIPAIESLCGKNYAKPILDSLVKQLNT